jgi:hypothetical protein
VQGIFSRLVWTTNIVWAIVISVLLVWTLMMLGRPTEFLYFQF